ncbi:alpha/beta hydrolase [Pseudenhygromyxa sp. WMMC2535]|uniref:alpha/beta hydrolase n=1 Tax=Pseudenhygromyxa sp. WMMC2535 TaxID=2712867 RepID=UPI0015538CC2|nr:alpha/beta hydrolase [Pseudenhygromyxa sp. WMMC2535]NVB39903.1 alpha/beta hydrolase [Pseudenhygromyxa sp. WMMC2535]
MTNEIRPALEGRSVEEQRVALDQIGGSADMPAGVAVKRVSIHGLEAEWLIPANATERVVLYLHGGGFIMGSCDSHRAIAARVATAARARALVIEYRLAPEHPFPAGLEDVITSYAWLLERGHAAEQIIFAGDSAGGGLAMSAILLAQERGLPQPGTLVMISPWTDLTMSGESLVTRSKIDPWLQQGLCEDNRSLYLCNGTSATDPLVSPVNADLANLPPTLIQVGDHEILLSDSERVAESARAAGVHVELEVQPEMWHVWHLMAPLLPEANEAYERIGAFIERRYEHPQISACG